MRLRRAQVTPRNRVLNHPVANDSGRESRVKIRCHGRVVKINSRTAKQGFVSVGHQIAGACVVCEVYSLLIDITIVNVSGQVSVERCRIRDSSQKWTLIE